MSEYKFPNQINLSWEESFFMGKRVPAIANRIFNTLENALAFINDDSPLGTAIPGLVLSVISDTDPTKNGAYYVKSVGEAYEDEHGNIQHIPGELVALGSNSPKCTTKEEVEEFTISENLGKLFYISQNITEGTGEDIKTLYTSGVYVVIGDGEIQKLAATSASGDFASDISALGGKIEELKNSYIAADNEIKNSLISPLSIKVDNILSYGYITSNVADSIVTSYIDKLNVNSLSSTGSSYVTVTVKQDKGLISSVSISDNDIASAATVSKIESKLSDLLGSEDTKPIKELIAEELAAQLISEDAKEALDTLQEIADWIQNHPDDVTEINTHITNLTSYITTLKGDSTKEGSIANSISTSLSKLSYTDTKQNNQYVVSVSQTNGQISVEKAELVLPDFSTAFADKSYESIVNGIANSYVTQTSYNSLEAVVNTLSGDFNQHVISYNTAISAVNNRIDNLPDYGSRVSGLESSVAILNNSSSSYVGSVAYISHNIVVSELKNINVTDNVVANQYISSISQTNGQISVTRADLPDWTGEITTAKSEANSYTAGLVDALLEKIASLESKLALYDERFGYPREGGEWTKNFLLID